MKRAEEKAERENYTAWVQVRSRRRGSRFARARWRF